MKLSKADLERMIEEIKADEVRFPGRIPTTELPRSLALLLATLARDVIAACEDGAPHQFDTQRTTCPWCAIYDRVTGEEP